MKLTLRFSILSVIMLALGLPALAQHVIATIPVAQGAISIVVNQKTNRIYVGGGNQTVAVIDGTTNTVLDYVGVLGEDSIFRPLLSYKNQVLVGNPDTQVDVMDGRTYNVTTVPTDYSWEDGSAQLGMSDWLYVSSFSHSQVAVVDATNVGVATAIIPVDGPMSVVANANTQRVYVTSSNGNDSTWSIAVIDANTNTVINSFPLGAVRLMGISVDPISNLLCVATAPAGSPGSISVLDGTTGALLGISQPIGPIFSILAIPGQHRVLVGGGRPTNRHNPNHVIFVDTDTFKITKVLEVGAVPSSIAYNPVTKRVYVANSDDNTVSVISN